MIDGLRGIGSENGISDQGRSVVGRQRGADQQNGVKAESGKIDLRLRISVDAEVASIGRRLQRRESCWEWDS